TDRLGPFVEPVGRQHIGHRLDGWNHRAYVDIDRRLDHTVMLHSLFVVNKMRMTSSSTWELGPLSPRSIVLSVLLGSHPPSMPVGRLLEFTSLFGIADGAVRTALSRL